MSLARSVAAEPRPGERPASGPPCRLCGAALHRTFADLGAQPSANAYLPADRLAAMEPTWPLHAYVCDGCRLVQLEALHSSEELFADYAYFASYSDSWLRHAELYVERMLERLGRDRLGLVVEVASNDGYLLQYFARAGVPVLGIDPAANVAVAAEERGVPTLVRYFGAAVAAELAAGGRRADLIVANNVLAHVPDINDFVSGFATLLQPDGMATLEFPHLLRLIAENQFDTIYHEHFSYLSLAVVERLFSAHGLKAIDVEELSTHGGSLRVFAARQDSAHVASGRVAEVRAQETAAGLDGPEIYDAFAERAARLKRTLVRTLMDLREAGKTIAAYGAPAKGNTLLNYCGIGPDLVAFTVDRSPHKQGRWLPGSRIPIHEPERLRREKPDYVLILPWNLRTEIMMGCDFIREWGGRFIVPIPEVAIVP
ncbi:MAG: class I SAM-dependent methyltransferase [Rhodospirillaceae bacterium]